MDRRDFLTRGSALSVAACPWAEDRRLSGGADLRFGGRP